MLQIAGLPWDYCTSCCRGQPATTATGAAVAVRQVLHLTGCTSRQLGAAAEHLKKAAQELQKGGHPEHSLSPALRQGGAVLGQLSQLCQRLAEQVLQEGLAVPHMRGACGQVACQGLLHLLGQLPHGLCLLGKGFCAAQPPFRRASAGCRQVRFPSISASLGALTAVSWCA